MADRAIVFIDGNNWYHALRDLRVEDLGRLDYGAVSRKLLGSRTWIGTRYYIGRVSQQGSPQLYADQRRFLANLQAADARITSHLGRLEPRLVDNPAARELDQYLASLTARLPPDVYRELSGIARKHRKTQIMIEKAVDVMLAVDMVVLGERDEYDAVYLLSADGDFTPAVEAVRHLGKKVYVASPARGAQLARVASSYIRMRRDWFDDCFRKGSAK